MLGADPAADLDAESAVAACEGTPVTQSAMALKTATAPSRPAAARLLFMAWNN